ncbi:hypothetical protein AB0C10_37715, partial [Microbispora amethystogenes]|uniref:hypothetical protein n=1 Tax=Microbispora amethystogenes TaxID=1427754 RepID=UPI0033CEA80E
RRFTAYRWHANGSWSHLDAGWAHLHTARAEVTRTPAGRGVGPAGADPPAGPRRPRGGGARIMILHEVTTWDHAHYADRVQFPGSTPMVVVTEPTVCPDGRRTCTCLTQTGRRVPVTESPSAPVTLLARPGSSELPGCTADVMAEHDPAGGATSTRDAAITAREAARAAYGALEAHARSCRPCTPYPSRGCQEGRDIEARLNRAILAVLRACEAYATTGDRVTYHGSKTADHGVWTVHGPTAGTLGAAYTLTRDDDRVLSGVRIESITPVGGAR